MYTGIFGNLLMYAGLGYHRQVIGQSFLRFSRSAGNTVKKQVTQLRRTTNKHLNHNLHNQLNQKHNDNGTCHEVILWILWILYFG